MILKSSFQRSFFSSVLSTWEARSGASTRELADSIVSGSMEDFSMIASAGWKSNR